MAIRPPSSRKTLKRFANDLVNHHGKTRQQAKTLMQGCRNVQITLWQKKGQRKNPRRRSSGLGIFDIGLQSGTRPKVFSIFVKNPVLTNEARSRMRVTKLV